MTWQAIPFLDRCNALSPDSLHLCAGPRGHYGYHASRNWPTRDWTWNDKRMWKLGNSEIALLPSPTPKENE